MKIYESAFLIVIAAGLAAAQGVPPPPEGVPPGTDRSAHVQLWRWHDEGFAPLPV